MQALGALLQSAMPEGLLRSLLVDGVVAGAGGVLVFLPQILILFLFILALEDSGYLPRAAFLLDRVMGSVGLSGRSFIPLLSSFACAIPGVMATRTISSWRDRLVTIMIAPLMTCSARLPVYALADRRLHPATPGGRTVQPAGGGAVLAVPGGHRFGDGGRVGLQAPAPQRVAGAAADGAARPTGCPACATWRQGLLERAQIFIKRVGSIILALMIVLWFISTFPAPPDGATGPAIQYSLAGMLGQALEPLFRPIGFNWQICIALIPGLAAREVAVGALGTVYALSAAGDKVAEQLAPMLGGSWSVATALSLLAWYVFAPQCISTLAAVKRETNSWRYPLMMAGYLFALAYMASLLTYRVALAFGL